MTTDPSGNVVAAGYANDASGTAFAGMASFDSSGNPRWAFSLTDPSSFNTLVKPRSALPMLVGGNINSQQALLGVDGNGATVTRSTCSLNGAVRASFPASGQIYLGLGSITAGVGIIRADASNTLDCASLITVTTQLEAGIRDLSAANDHFVIAGYYIEPLSGGCSVSFRGFVRKFDSSGALIWNYEPADVQFRFDAQKVIEITEGGVPYIYVAGMYKFCGVSPNAAQILKLDSNGNVIWHLEWSSDSIFNALVTDPSGGVLGVGSGCGVLSVTSAGSMRWQLLPADAGFTSDSTCYDAALSNDLTAIYVAGEGHSSINGQNVYHGLLAKISLPAAN